MNKNTIIVILNLIAASLLHGYPYADASPYFEIGLKVTKFNTTFGVSDYLGNELQIFENHLGLSAEFLLSIFNDLYFRLELIEIRKYEYTGDIQFLMMSNLAMDIEYLIPITRSVKPLVYLGTKYGAFDYRSPEDTIFEVTNREFHLGLGVAHHIRPKSKIVFEFQIYSDNKWWWGDSDNWDQIQTWGFEKLNLGFRYNLFRL